MSRLAVSLIKIYTDTFCTILFMKLRIIKKASGNIKINNLTYTYIPKSPTRLSYMLFVGKFFNIKENVTAASCSLYFKKLCHMLISTQVHKCACTIMSKGIYKTDGSLGHTYFVFLSIYYRV